LSLAAVVTAAEMAPPPRLVPYFPTKAGAKWVYADGGTEDRVVLLSDVESKGGATVLTLVTREPGDKTAPHEKLRISEKGVFQTEALGKAVDPPRCVLKLPVTKGQKWEESSKEDGLEIKTTYTAFGPEDVEVPAGKFKAIRVELETVFTSPNGTKSVGHRLTEWYAPGVGCIKQVGGEAVTVLKSFTPGND
jgi:hypothetical protein